MNRLPSVILSVRSFAHAQDDKPKMLRITRGGFQLNTSNRLCQKLSLHQEACNTAG